MNPVNRAVFFATLAQYHEAGLTLDVALLESAKQQPSLKASFARTASLLRGGMPLEKAGSITRLFRPWEARLLAIGTQHGRLDLTLAELARYYSNSANWWRKLRLKLTLPAVVLVLGWLILPLPNLVSGELSIPVYLTSNGVLLALLWLGWRWMTRTAGYPSFLDGLLDHPPVGKLLWAYHRSRFLNALALLIGAGVPAQDALQETVNSCRSPRLRAAWQKSVTSLQGGSSLAASLKTHGVLDATGYSLIDTGEASGKLVDMLKHERDRLEGELQLKLEILAEWLPWGIYLAVVLLLLGRMV
jgi:type II secretory pathway component PulF